jgi:hypothetical protein
MLRAMPTLAVLACLIVPAPALAAEVQPMVTHEEELELQQLPMLDAPAHMGASVRPMRPVRLGQAQPDVLAATGLLTWHAPVSLAAGSVVGAGLQLALQGPVAPWAGLAVGAAAGLGLHTAWSGLDAYRAALTGASNPEIARR